MGFSFDIKGQLNSMRLAESKALWPLFEAVVNSIQAIEDSPNRGSGKIIIHAYRKPSGQTTLDKKEPLERFEAFSVTDNGLGLNKANYESFNTAYSTLKMQKGCKGIGRFLWLKAFESVEVKSNFVEDGVFFHREFTFSPDGIQPEENLTPAQVKEFSTTVLLKNFQAKYQNAAPVELEAVAKKIIEHCLLFFVSDQCPEITICDDISDSINLNHYYRENIKDSLNQDRFIIKDESFTIYHLRLPEGVSGHELHLCANMQEVSSTDLKNYIPDLHNKIMPANEPGFFYVGYVVSAYLDARVNVTRTEFDFDENGDQITLWGTGKDAILSSAIEYVKGYLGDYLLDINKQKRKQIDDFVALDRPAYRYLLQKKPEVYDHIPSGLRPEALEIELHKETQAWEMEIKKKAIELEKVAAEAISDDDTTYHELYEQYWEAVTEISKTALAEYVTRRKTILKLLDDALTIKDDGGFKKEDVIHSLICPMRHTSDDVTFEEMNLWIVDERLAYHRFLASDKTLKSMPVIDSNSRKEPDIAIFDQAFAYSDSDEPFSTVTIVEFKKPDNDGKNPINQVGEYVDLIRAGKKAKANGQSFTITDGTLFRCYVICDLTDKMRTHCLNSSLLPTADNLGYTGFNQVRHEYIEVISYSKLLADAKKRNQILFDKLFAPKPGEVIHAPEAN